MRTCKTLHVKGIHSPMALWCRGFLHGRVIHTGGLDPETNTISSSYITGQLKGFQKACILRREKAETKLTKAWTEVDQLLIEYAAVASALADLNVSHSTQTEGNAQARANERLTAARVSRLIDRQDISKKLSDIANEIMAEVDNARDQMEATAAMLLNAFASYGHGLLMKPVYPRSLPHIDCTDYANEILTNHANTWNAVVSILKEVKE